MHQFAIDKASAAIYEAIAIDKIEAWYRLQGKQVTARYNERNGLEEKRGFDLIDTFGVKWEVKSDRKWSATGNVFLEHKALDHSQADFWIILAGFAYILPRQKLIEVRDQPHRVVPGGDDLRFLGTLLPLEELRNISQIV